MRGREERLSFNTCVLQLLQWWQENWGSVGASEKGRLVPALPRWHSAAGGRQQEAATAVWFGVYFRGCSDPQGGLMDCSGDLPFVLIPGTMGLSGY